MVFWCSLLGYILEFIARHNYVQMVFEYGLIVISFATFMFVIIGVIKSCKHAKHGLKAQQIIAQGNALGPHAPTMTPCKGKR